VRRMAAAVVIAVLTLAPASAEQLTVAVSMPAVQITSNFTGAPIAVFGVIETDAGATPASDYQVAVVVLGPDETAVERRKDRLIAIWANRAAETIASAPAFYSLATSAEPAALAKPEVLQRLDIGFNNLDLGQTGATPQTFEFRDAFVRLKQKAGLYGQSGAIKFIGPLIFRTTTFLPANVPVGRYTVVAYLFSGGQLVAHGEDAFVVSKSGAEGSIADFARSQSLVYGLLCAGLALFIGWAGGVIFRRD
jgi:uncharacterized protein (TIGR02186 family)